MSFLEHFKFQVDAAKGTSSMVRIRTDSEVFRNDSGAPTCRRPHAADFLDRE